MTKRKSKARPRRRPPTTSPPTTSLPDTLPARGGSPDVEAARKAINQAMFLANFVIAGNVKKAAELSKLDRNRHYDWMANDPTYPERFKAAEADAVDVLETEARRRALVGTDKGIYYKGKRVDTVKEYSDVLLMFLLNGRRPEVFKQRHEHTGKNGSPIQHQHAVAPVGLHELDDAELAVAERIAARIEAAKSQAIPVQSTHA